MNQATLLKNITEQYQDNCVIITKEIFNGKPIIGRYYFDTLEMALAFFTSEYNDQLVRKEHNTQILSWEIVYGI